MTRCWGRVAVCMAGLAAFAGQPAGAHARLVGSAPEDGSTVEVAPREVTIDLDAKPATVEGDPLQVYAPDGRRVDAGDARVERRGRTLTVGVDHDLSLPSGDYQIAYRVVSTDSHVIAGRLSFSTRRPATPGHGAARASASGGDSDGDGDRQIGTAWVPDRGTAPAASPDGRLVASRTDDVWPRLVAAGALLLAVAAVALRIVRGWVGTSYPPSQQGVSGQPYGRRRQARHQRPGRRSSPVGAGLRLPPPDGAPDRRAASSSPMIVSGRRPHLWSAGRSTDVGWPRALPARAGTAPARTAIAPWRRVDGEDGP
jgi:methionine-rich copper-binding protein CopC